MIAGEGTVFALILGLGIYRTRNTFKKEFELSKQQKNFMLSITHELKSPIASARLQIETLLKRQLPKQKQELPKIVVQNWRVRGQCVTFF